MPHAKKIVASVLLSAYLLIGVGGLENLVLCFGSDGHIALEVAMAAESCDISDNRGESDASLSNTSPRQYFTESANHCGPCNDIPITDRYRQPARKDAKHLLPIETSAHFFHTVSVKSASQGIPVFSNPHLPALQSTPLRI